MLSPVLDLLAREPLLLLFSVAAVGVLVGRVRIAGVTLGLAGVLFTGLAVAAVDERLVVDALVLELGLALFLYAVGISSGPTFARALRGRGLAEAGSVVATLLVAAGVALTLGAALDLSGQDLAGVVAGGLTNTPALAAAIEGARSDTQAASTITVAFATGYPIGIVLALLATSVVLRGGDEAGDGDAPLERRTARVVGAAGQRVDHALAAVPDVTAVRIHRDRGETLVEPDVRLRQGDLVTVVGPITAVREAIDVLGEAGGDDLFLDRRALDFRGMTVSDSALAGRRLGEVDLRGRFGAMATRVQRGDVEWLARDDTVLELGDRLLVVAPPHRLEDVAAYLGDSMRRVGEIDILTIGVGLTLGLGVGLVDVPLPGGGSFALGFAGGPIVVGLLLGALGRTGPLVWQIPHSANLTIRQLGSALFLAAVGTRAGAGVAEALTDPASLRRVLVTVAVGAAVAGTAVGLLGRVLNRSAPRLAGLVAGVLSQPAALALATDRSSDPEVVEGYATAFPVALIGQIALAAILAGLG